MTTPPLTAEEFVERKPDLPDGGRWVELVGGEVMIHEPPSEVHGNVVLNLSKRLADHLQNRPADQPGYACFEMGIIAARHPDTVRCPAVSFFTTGNRFEALEEQITEHVPELVIEIASTNSRRNAISDRVREYHTLGVAQIWIIDPIDEVTHICPLGQPASTKAATELLTGDPLLPGFSFTANELFAAPKWWC